MREAIAAHFNKDELRVLCHDLNFDTENLAHNESNRGVWALEIVTYCQRAGRIDALRRQCAKQRPDVKVDWMQIPAAIANAVEHTIESLHHLIQVSPEVHNSLTGIVAVFEQTRKQIRLMVEYKGTHDRLQHLELSYWLFYPLVFEANSLKLSEDINWSQARTQRRAITRDINAVLAWSKGRSFETEAGEWLTALDQAQHQLNEAITQQDPDLLEMALDTVRSVLHRQISSMNDRLMTATEALALNALVNRFVGMTEKIKTLPNISQLNQAALKFGEFDTHLSASQLLAAQLQQLRQTHNQWQGFDNVLRDEQTQLEQRRDLKRFQRRWQQLRQNAQYVSLWSGALHEMAADIDHSLSTNTPEQGICDLFFEFCSEARQIFTTVDNQFNRLCSELKDVENPLDRLVNALRMGAIG